LLLSLDEGGNDFLSGGDTSLSLDLGEGILNDVDVSYIHIHQVFLFLILSGCLGQTHSQDFNWVGKALGIDWIKLLGGELCTSFSCLVHL
jgi:hypothetical protein